MSIHFARRGGAALATLVTLLALLGACSDDATSEVTVPSSSATASAGTSQPGGSPAAELTPGAGPEGELVASTAKVPTEQLDTVEFLDPSGAVIARLPLEVPPSEEYTIGLSGRRVLGDRGMLFDYGRADYDGAFWMKNTHFDLDIAFVGADRRIVAIKQMRAESLEHVTSPSPYQYAIEAPYGWYGTRGIEAGDEVRFGFTPPSQR
jgi:uncharacterized membrane protein (UPF0127 family)